MRLNVLTIITILYISVLSCNKDDNNETTKNEVENEQEEEPTNNEVPTNNGVTINSNWYIVDYLQSSNTYIIKEPKSSQGNVSYMIIGENKALMFDTGSGENQSQNGSKMKHVTDQLTSLPTSLLLSHFHFDHNQNISEFETIAFPDLSFLKQRVADDNIFSFSAEELFLGNTPSQIEVNEWLPVNTDIDLGNRIIQLLNIPGHTKESIAIIDKTNKLAFLGDYLYNGSLFIFSNDDITPYKESVDILISKLSSDYKLYGAHGAPQISYNKLNTLKNFLICIENKTCESTENTVFGKNVLVYNFEGMSIVVFQ